jgi:hypothetical protein
MKVETVTIPNKLVSSPVALWLPCMTG